MPKYRIRLSDGRTVVVEAPAPPSEQAVLAALQAPQEAAPKPSKPARTWGDFAADLLPTAGGILGGIAGAPLGPAGAMGGAALGGALGSGGRLMTRAAQGKPEPPSIGAMAGEMGREGLTQGIAEGGGRLISGALRLGGRALMDNAVRPTQALLREFPEVVETLIKERLPVGRGVIPTRTPNGLALLKGSQQAKGQLRDSAATTRNLLNKADAAGTTFDPADLTKPVSELRSDIGKQAIAGPDLRKVDALENAFLREHPKRMSATATKDLKRAEQGIAKPIFRARDKGSFIPGSANLRAGFADKIASGAKRQLETIKGVGASEARTQGLIGATQALKAAEARRLPLSGELGSLGLGAVVAAGSGDPITALGSYAGARLLTSPRTTSRLALGATHPVTQGLSQQALRALVLARLFGEDESATK